MSNGGGSLLLFVFSLEKGLHAMSSTEKVIFSTAVFCFILTYFLMTNHMGGQHGKVQETPCQGIIPSILLVPNDVAKISIGCQTFHPTPKGGMEINGKKKELWLCGATSSDECPSGNHSFRLKASACYILTFPGCSRDVMRIRTYPNKKALLKAYNALKKPQKLPRLPKSIMPTTRPNSRR